MDDGASSIGIAAAVIFGKSDEVADSFHFHYKWRKNGRTHTQFHHVEVLHTQMRQEENRICVTPLLYSCLKHQTFFSWSSRWNILIDPPPISLPFNTIS